jgi:hypothetical protein
MDEGKAIEGWLLRCNRQASQRLDLADPSTAKHNRAHILNRDRLHDGCAGYVGFEGIEYGAILSE